MAASRSNDASSGRGDMQYEKEEDFLCKDM